MTVQRWAWLAALLAGVGCVDMEPVPPRDAGVPVEPEDAGGPDAGGKPDAGPRDAGPPTPDDTLVSIGVTDNSGGAPQAAPILQLKFHGGVAGPGVIAARRISTPIVLDGTSSDWIGVPESLVPLLTRGGAVGLSKDEWTAEYTLLGSTPPLYDFGVAQIAVRAAYDDARIYFLLQWADPTENRDRDTWYVDGGVFVRSRDNEDRAYLGFDINKSSPAFQAIGCSGACHIQERLGDVSDAGKAYRTRMHTNYPGEAIDVWSWRAATTDPMGAADDGYIDDLSRKSDGPQDWIVSNQGDGGPGFMSDLGVNANPVALYRPDGGSTKPWAVPFNPFGAAPTARIPGYLMQRASPFRDDVSAAGRWAGGYWTVEFSRALTNTDPRDLQFPLK